MNAVVHHDPVNLLAVCEACNGSGIEFIEAGHGNINEEPCSMCSVEARVAKVLHEKMCEHDVNGYLNANIDAGKLATAVIATLSQGRVVTNDEKKILKLIAEGYFERCENDRFIFCANPDFRPDDGSDEFVVYDIGVWVFEEDGR